MAAQGLLSRREAASLRLKVRAGRPETDRADPAHAGWRLGGRISIRIHQNLRLKLGLAMESMCACNVCSGRHGLAGSCLASGTHFTCHCRETLAC